MFVPPKGISTAIHKNETPHENVALYGNRASRPNLFHPTKGTHQNAIFHPRKTSSSNKAFYENRAPIQGMGYPLGKGLLAFHKNGALLQKAVASPKATYAQKMVFYENRPPIQKVVYPPWGTPTAPYKNGAPSQKMALYENKVSKQANPLIHFERNPAKGNGVMTSQDGQKRITRSMSKGVTIKENVQIPIEESSSEEISSPI
ncbi:hypothetical protein ACH5RR_021548 [Cinchona calisaya]|uniref:Uncharacterized protein n=1 Tax=Cinchona calisaya TaxID=153742 RepID=A0ABD2ZIL9_9GENT